MNNDIVYFIKDNTPLSKKMEMYLNINKIEYTLLDFDNLNDELKGQLTDNPPVIVYNNQALYGFDAESLNKLLK